MEKELEKDNPELIKQRTQELFEAWKLGGEEALKRLLDKYNSPPAKP